MLLLALACSDTGFTALPDDGPEGVEPAPWTDTQTEEDAPADSADTGGATQEVPEDTSPPDVPDTGKHEPLTCTLETMVHLVGAGDCPADHAAMLMDDGQGPNVVCCPLPADDILREVPANERGTTCNPTEVLTGFSGAYQLRCTPVNTQRYEVGPPKKPCYFGSGASGGSGVQGCNGHPHSWDLLQQNLFGSDGCSGQPYGALFMSQTGKDCEDMQARQLFYNGSVAGDPPKGSPVHMFPK